MSPFIRVVRAHEEETVEIAWTCADGSRYVQRVTIPPKATREAQAQPPLEFDEPRNAAGQVTDRSQTSAAGQRFSTSTSPELLDEYVAVERMNPEPPEPWPRRTRT